MRVIGTKMAFDDVWIGEFFTFVNEPFPDIITPHPES